MGFFKDFKDELSEAVDELIPIGAEDEELMAKEAAMTEAPKTVDTEMNSAEELNKLDGLLEQVSKKVEEREAVAAAAAKEPERKPVEEPKPVVSRPVEPVREQQIRMPELDRTNIMMNMKERTVMDTQVRENIA